jgi:hypothetical protein
MPGRTFRRLLLAWALGVPASLTMAALTPSEGKASVVVAMTLKDLVDRSESVVVGLPKSRTSRWEGGRIVTYTTVAIDTSVAGSGKAGETLTMRTLGGVVDGIGQIVHGEAVLKLGAPVMIFVGSLSTSYATTVMAGSRSVVGMSQGVLPVVVGTDKIPRIGLSATDLTLVTPPDAKTVPAHVATNGRAVVDVTTEVRLLWAARAKK